MYAKVEGAKNVKHTIKSFFIDYSLMQQKSYQQLAIEKRLQSSLNKKMRIVQ
ncbi:hypothetical protein EAG_09025 [Camponotus floridanus]|uniref:Uncharacterized protein n=1 Tax=Camponotus floridanus TaxID=104421 RepID=E2AQV1_CAMFO|nr:hypothetical protein EAG_09025 [Camponotus floridanus]